MTIKTAILGGAVFLALGGYAVFSGLPLVGGMLEIPTAAAQSDDERKQRNTKEVDSLRQPVYEDIAEAQAKITPPEGETTTPEDKAEGVADLKELLAEGDMNEYESAIALQILAQEAIDANNYPQAVQYFEDILNYSRIPVGITQGSLNALGQLYFSLENYEKAIEYTNRWLEMQDNPGPRPYEILSQAYYQMENWDNVISYAEKAIEVARQRGMQVKENWYLLMRAGYFEQENFQKVAEVLEILAVNFDKPEYWRQLANVYSETAGPEKRLAAMEVAYRRGFLETESHYRTLAQLYLYMNVPIKAAWVMDEGMKEGIVEKTDENYELLGMAYLNASEDEKAQEPLRLAAEAEDDGELWLRLGQVYAGLEEWQKAVEPLQKAIDSDDLDEVGFAHFMLGQAYFNIEEFDAARRAFREARDYDETEDSARQWLDYVSREVERRKQLSEYYGDDLKGDSGGE